MDPRKLIFSVLAAGFSLASSPLVASTDTTTLAGPDVAYSSVTELSYSAAQQRLSYGDDPLQFIDLWPTSGVSAPLVVFIHGGCWLNAYNIDHTRPAATALQQAGYAVASIEYRRTGDNGGGWPGTWHDIQNAMQRLIALPELALRERHVVVMGHSAGGHLALLAGSAFAESVDHVVGLAAITDLAAYTAADGGCQQAGAQFMQSASASDWQQANPIEQDIKVAVTLLQGGADSIVPTEQARAYAQKGAVQVVLAESAGHFDWVHPNTAAWQQLLTTLEAMHD
ncbi:alpha/beta hydrolase [Pseudidiomarina sp. 1APR75-15]|uniref:Alpha/beta hydrolase n=1 Tax=Pseudidiomarina terrestris TaxID=2820060 RepID=A0ABT8MJ18_9GAMM|nr:MULTISPECIES: alpha/beta hydrolase [unclassified Pseudidiomarina]MDN7129936.1 alpha/beta hydrolase [Pseudidiomarina sp. 1APR75-15]MDN7138373.1 alpha/beta hydrolase [Pseudidiomarina sp. 1ASP75-14]